MKKRNFMILVLVICMILAVVPMGIVASAEQPRPDAMDAIEADAELSKYKVGTTTRIDDDGYIGIPLEVSVYYDTAKPAKTGFNGTAIMIYVVNTMVERIGTTSDTDIIKGMLDRGYAVVIFDYLNNEKAVSPDLDWSCQLVRQDVTVGASLLPREVFESGNYPNSYVLPAGYDILMEATFFELDKHGAAGSLNAIVESWNTDLKGCKPNVVVPWVYTDGELAGQRKTTAKDLDGADPVWYSDAEGKNIDNKNGTYTKLRWTVATDVTDCINPDGTPVDLNLYISVLYPSEGNEKLPVMAWSSSQGTLSAVSNKAERPQLNGSVFNGYVGVVYDHTWIPMARNKSFDYYDGNDAGGVTGDGLSYQIEFNNDKEVKTAAMRFLRYLELDNPGVYNMNTDKIGVYGNSKGGWFSLLGEAMFQEPLIANPEDYATTEELEIAITQKQSALYDKRIFEGHHGESRFEALYIEGKTEASVGAEKYESYTRNGITIDAGEVQPWLTYNGVELISGAQLIYPSCGSSPEDVGDGHVPMFLINNVYDGPYSTSNTFPNVARNHDIVTLFFEVNIGHTFTSGPDADHGVETYKAFFDFCGYHLKGDAVKVVWATPKEGTVGFDVTEGITVKFLGSVAYEEVLKITVADSKGDTVNGEWSSIYGDTEWTFLPYDMKGYEDYTLTVPASVKGDNGKEMGVDFVRHFSTKPDSNTAASSVVNVDNGSFTTFTVPALSADTNRYFFRFRVANDAANIAELYAVDSFNTADPELSDIGKLLGKVSLKGKDIYEIDITDYIATKAGQSITLFVKEQKTEGTSQITYNGFDSAADVALAKKNRYSQMKFATAPDGEASLESYIVDNGNGWGYGYRFTDHVFYSGPSTAFTYANILGANAFTKEDYGRKFTISFKVYDETSRLIQVILDHCTDESYETVDYQYCIKNFRTVAGEWTTMTLEYTVYDMEYGYKGIAAPKGLTISAFSDGDKLSKMYFDDLTVTETVTGADMTDFAIATKDFGGADYKAPTADMPFTLYNGATAGESYATLSDALTAYIVGDADRIKLNSNYTFTDSDIFDGFTAIENIVIDLNGYTINCENTAKSLFYIKNGSNPLYKTAITVINGGINIGDTPLISYEESTADGAGKKVDISFENIAFGILDGAFTRGYFTASTIADGSKCEVNIAVDLCTFDIPDEKLPYNSFNILPVGAGDLKVTYELTSPVFNLTSQRWVKVQKDTMYSVFNKDGDKPYATLILGDAEYPWDTAYAMTDTYGIFASREDKDGRAYYYLTESELATKYGMIPSEYADAEEYPWIVFDKTGRVLLAAHYLAGDSSKEAALGYVAQRTVGEWYIFLRRDYDYVETNFNNFGFIMGDVTIDLNNKTVYGKSTKRIFDAVAKAGKYANIYVQNGTLVGETQPILRFSSTTTGSYDGSETKTMHFFFDNVTFKASGTVDSLFVSAAEPTVNVIGNLNFNNCIFDLTDAKAGFKLFNLTQTTEKLSSEVVINGGTFKSDTFDGVGLYTEMNSKSSILFAKDENGNYPKAITTAADAYPPSDNIVTEEGNMMFGDGVTEGGITTYSLKVNTLLTPYGTIPEQYSDAEEWPFLLFYDGAFHSAYTAWADSSSANGGSSSSPLGVLCQGAKDNIWRSKTRTVTILLRRDYVIQTGGYSNLSQINGTVNIDLDGHTLTGGTASMFSANKKTNYNTTFNVKNGTLLIKGAPLISFGHGDNGNGYGFHLSFNGVKIGYASGATATNIIETFTTAITAGKVITSSLKLTNCEIDLSTNAPSDKITFIQLHKDPDHQKTDVTIEGCSIKSAASFNFVQLDNSNKTNAKDTVTFKPYNGEYIKLTMSSGAAAPTAWFDTDIGQMKFYKSADDGTTAEYIFANLETKYGAIGGEYADANKYPFALFKLNNDGVTYSFVKGYECWADVNNGGSGNPYGALTGAKDNGWGKTVVIVLRRDYVIETGKFDNLSHINGTIKVDLQGNTLTTGTASLFAATAKKSDNRTPSFEVFDGKILLYKGALVSAATGNNSNGQIFNFAFTNVDIGFAEGATVKKLVYDGSDSSQDIKTYLNITFNGCRFDLKTNAPTGTLSLFDFTVSTTGKHIADIQLNGGSITAANASKFVIVKLYDDSDAFAMGKYGDSYPEIKVASGSLAPEGEYNDGALVFKLKSDDGTTATYTLVPAASIGLDFTPKASVTLDSNLIFNIYIPAHAGLGAVTLNGETVTLGEANDGYYLVTVELPANEAAKLLTLTVEINEDGTDVIGSFTFSTVKYAEKLLTMDITNQEKTLAKDILAYIKSAYEYFTVADRTALIDEIDAILGSYVSDKVINADDAKCDTEGLSGATFVLGATPAIRFYLDGYTADKFSFKVGERALSASEATTGSDTDGSYVQFTLFAYEMTETFSYVIDVEEGEDITGEYNIVSYYADAVAKSDTALADIVAKFYNYCKSAYEYKLAVTNQ